MHVVSMVSNFPSSLQHLDVPLTPKEGEGDVRRPIGHFKSSPGLFGAAHKHMTRAWEAEFGMGGGFSATQTRAPSDSVWRASVRAVWASGQKLHILHLLWDIKKLYEH
eukprot:9489102-Pyramimonas_sp.AAC.1